MIRKAGLKDLDNLVELWKGLLKDQMDYRIPSSEDIVLPDLKQGAPDIFREFARRTIFSRYGLLLVAEGKEGDLQGYLLGFIQKNIPVFKEERIGYISDIYVAPEHRSRGLASSLKSEFEKWLKEKGIASSTLQVISTNNRARALYGRWGYGDTYVTMRKNLG